jgi:quinol monooxygenase YgiN
MKKFSLFGKLIAHEGKRDELVQLLMEGVSFLENFPGCEWYVIHVSDQEPDSIWVTEIWRDEAAHQASLQQSEIKSIIQRGRPLIAGFEKYRPVGGVGRDSRE